MISFLFFRLNSFLCLTFGMSNMQVSRRFRRQTCHDFAHLGALEAKLECGIRRRLGLGLLFLSCLERSDGLLNRWERLDEAEPPHKMAVKSALDESEEDDAAYKARIKHLAIPSL